MDAQTTAATATILPTVINAASGLAGVALGSFITYLVTVRNIKAQETLQTERFDREARAARLSTISAMRRLLPYARAAATLAQHNLDLWQPAVKVLADRVVEPTTVLGFPNDDDWHLVSDAAAEASLGLTRLEGLPSNPFFTNLDRRNSDVDNAQTGYVGRIRDIGERLYDQLSLALGALGHAVPDIEPVLISDAVDQMRMGIGQQSLAATRQNPDGLCVHR